MNPLCIRCADPIKPANSNRKDYSPYCCAYCREEAAKIAKNIELQFEESASTRFCGGTVTCGWCNSKQNEGSIDKVCHNCGHESAPAVPCRGTNRSIGKQQLPGRYGEW